MTDQLRICADYLGYGHNGNCYECERVQRCLLDHPAPRGSTKPPFPESHQIDPPEVPPWAVMISIFAASMIFVGFAICRATCQ